MKRKFIRLTLFVCSTFFTTSIIGMFGTTNDATAQILRSVTLESISEFNLQQYANAFESLDTASWEGYKKPKTVNFKQLKGDSLKGLDFVLDKHLREMFDFALINPEEPRYGLYEFDDVERIQLNKNDTLYAIIAAPGCTGNNWESRFYMFWTKNDTVAKDSWRGDPINYPIYPKTHSKKRLKSAGRIIYSMGVLKECLSTSLLGADSLDALPPRYWAPLEEVEGDPNKYITFGIKMIFKDGIITRAWITEFYNGAVNQIVRY